MAFNVGDQDEIFVQVRLLGAGTFAAEADAVTASEEEMALGAQRAAAGMKEATGRSWLMSQAMFTLRRFVYAGTLAITGLATASVYMGLKFDAAMQQNTVSMTHFLGSTAAAKSELQTLYQLAATTPFEFMQVTDAAKRFLAFGFSVKQTNSYLRILADTASGVGGGAETIDRIVLAIGQMQAKGRVMGQELLQLEEVGIPAMQILQKQLHLTDDQMVRIGNTGIKASAAIPALMRGLNQQFGGLSKQQAKTFSGELSTLHDYAMQTLGTIMTPLFNKMQRDIFPMAIKIATALQQGFGQGGLAGALAALNRSNAPGWFKALFGALAQTVKMFQTLWPLIKPFAYLVAGILYIGLVLLNDVLGQLNRHGTTARVIIAALVYWFILWKITSSMVVLQTKAVVFWAGVQVWYTKALILWTRLWILWSQRDIYWTGIKRAAYILYVLTMAAVSAALDVLGFSAAAAAVEMYALDTAMWANPIGLFALLILGLALAFFILWKKSGTFRDVVRSIGSAFMWMYGMASIALAGLGKQIDDLKNKITGIPLVHQLFEINDAVSVSGLFNGIQNAGSYVHQFMPWAGPTEHTGPVPAAKHGHKGNQPDIVIPIHLDRKKIGEAVAKYNQDVQARQ